MLNKLLNELVEIDSSTKDGANKTINYCEQWLSSKGLESKIINNNGYHILICEIGKGDKKIIWNGHVDVVNASEHQFIPQEEDGKLYGRGTADMKAGVAALMCAMIELKDENLNLRIQLQLVPDEESGGSHGSNFLSESGYIGDFVICPEPTQLGIGLQSKGVLQLDLTVTGKSAHGSRPWEGENAIVKANEIFWEVLDLPFLNESSDFFQAPSVNIAKVEGGDAYNKVPDSCVMSLDIRYLPNQDYETIIQQINGISEDISDVDIHLSGSPVRNKENDQNIQNIIAATRNITGEDDVKVFGQHGFADTRFFSKYDVPAIEFGPCGENWHGSNEFVVLESAELYKKILINFILLSQKN